MSLILQQHQMLLMRFNVYLLPSVLCLIYFGLVFLLLLVFAEVIIFLCVILLKIILFIIVFRDVPWHMCGGQRTICRDTFSLPSLYVSGDHSD